MYVLEKEGQQVTMLVGQEQRRDRFIASGWQWVNQPTQSKRKESRSKGDDKPDDEDLLAVGEPLK